MKHIYLFEKETNYLKEFQDCYPEIIFKIYARNS